MTIQTTPHTVGNFQMNHAPRGFAIALTALASVGLSASATLTIDLFKLLTDASYRPPCNLNPLFSCSSVMRTPQAALFGFPNSIIGVIGFSVVVTLGVLTLVGTTIARSIWIALLAFLGIGQLWVFYLMYQSVFSIGALCLFCIAVWLVQPALCLLILRFLIRNPAWKDYSVWYWVALIIWYFGAAIVVVKQFY